MYIKHGFSRTPEHRAWTNMRYRCLNKRCKHFHNYGGRGITVCERWNDFANFYADMGPRPSANHSLDRYPDNNGNYQPGNCRWATQKQQLNNVRHNRFVLIKGKREPVARAAAILGVTRGTLHTRFSRGWTPDRLASKGDQRRFRKGGNPVHSDQKIQRAMDALLGGMKRKDVSAKFGISMSYLTFIKQGKARNYARA